jgi:hypothetical protein
MWGSYQNIEIFSSFKLDAEFDEDRINSLHSIVSNRAPICPLGNKALTMPTASSLTSLDKLLLVRVFFKNDISISLAAVPRTFLSSAVGGADAVLGARWGE